MEDNMNVIAIEEDRDFIKKARNLYEKAKAKEEQIQKSYQENIVDTGISEDIEKKIEKKADLTKKTIAVAGTVATVALMICPADGPFGEIATLLATPAFIKLVDVAADIQKKIVISGKRGIEKHMLNVDTNNDSIKGYNLTNGEIVEDFKKVIETGKELSL